MTVQARELDRGFVGLGAGVAEKHVVHGGQLAQAFGEFGLLRNFEPVGDVQQLAGLVADGGGHRRVRVAEVAYRHAGERIEIFLAGRIPQPGAFAVREGHGQGGKYRHLV